MSDLHYIFKNDKVYAVREGKVIAEAASLAELEKMAWAGAEQAGRTGAPCPNCQDPTSPTGDCFNCAGAHPLPAAAPAGPHHAPLSDGYPDAGPAAFQNARTMDVPEFAQRGPVPGPRRPDQDPGVHQIPDFAKGASAKTAHDDGPDYGYGEQRAVNESGGGQYHGQCSTCGSRGQVGTNSGLCEVCEGDEAARDPLMRGLGNGFHDPSMGTSFDYHDDHPPHHMAATVVGPGGLKGKVLGKVRGLWSDEVAVRFENGRIAHLRVLNDGSLQGGFTESIEKVASTRKSASDELRARLETRFEPTRAGIAARFTELEAIRAEGRAHIASASAAEAAALDSIMLTAEVERGTLRQALDAIEADEAAQAEFAPYAMQAAPAQESLGSGEGNWLDGVVSAMVAEAESQDFDAMLKEEPHMFVASLNDAAVVDMGVTRDMASNFIRSRTAGLATDRRDDIARTFLANVEDARKREASTRKQTIHKEAASREDKFKDLPDDILFY